MVRYSWGKLASLTGTLASTIGADNPFRYRGYYYDTETSLYYLNQRYYNPEWGRFINADDYMGQTGGLLSHNVFAYCANNPIVRSDESGQCWHILIGAVVGAVAGVIGQVVSDIITSGMSGEGIKLSSWQTYVGAAVGGAAGGATFAATGNAQLAGAVTGATTTFVGEGLKKLTIDNYEKSWGTIAAESAVDGLIGAATSTFMPSTSPVTGQWSYDSVYKAGLTKIRNETVKNMSLKVVGKGTVATIFNGLPLDIWYGIKQTLSDGSEVTLY